MNKEILKYPQFVDYVLNHIEDYLNDDTIRDIELVPAVKNNEIVTDALKVSYRDCPARPLLYLGAYFEEYCQDADIEQVMTQIAGGCGPVCCAVICWNHGSSRILNGLGG